MGHWDELCLLCGISPIPPSDIHTDPGYGAEDLAEKIIAYDSSLLEDMGMDEEGLQDLLYSALTAELDDGFDWFTRPGWRWRGFERCIAIGHFLVDGDAPHEIVSSDKGDTRRIPDGQGVQTRLVEDTNCGDFRKIILESVDEEGSVVEKTEEKLSSTSAKGYMDGDAHGKDAFGNFFLSEGCYHYLQAWLDFERLPQARHDRQLTFAGELYEVINSRSQGRVYGMGILPYIDYDGIERTLDQTQYDIAPNLNAPKHTAASIKNQDPSQKTFDAILRDCRFWMFLAPDMWPFAEAGPKDAYSLSKFTLTSPADALKPFPSSVLLHLAHYVDGLATYLALARTSKQLYNTLTDSTFLNQVLKVMAASSSRCLFWLRPVAAMRGEKEKAEKALLTYLPEESNADIGSSRQREPTSNAPLDHKDFPWYYFVRRCFETDSMRNRKRIWGQVKQLEEVWRDYRTNGWQVDRFGVSITMN